ncbi:hypothetical protein VA596_34530 [Amycolatopsis sp., V23-08]|uniref:SMODS-associating 2TM beta-strand rich effector domain-containing protein n=1 Tax=Amycolatopsis heterodermiae TaxID=3110235 RepID=A0ABU5REI2_9PSEU|nr:hypothetical protein [Amycolatopsis sp., V23-08]MEA5364692.1 hypothetical protein [Amycolatopsis sp., V23-08]
MARLTIRHSGKPANKNHSKEMTTGGHRIARRWAAKWQFWLLLTFTATLAVREICRAALGSHATAIWVLKVELVGVGPSVTFLVGSLSLLLVRNQFALGLRPFISYNSRWMPSHEDSVYLTEAEGPIWSVTIRNSGSGLALIRRVTLSVQAAGATEFFGIHEEVTDHLLTSCQLKLNRDYALSKLSPGGVLSPGNEVRIFELTEQSGSEFDNLSIVVEFEGALKDMFIKKIICIPPSGLPPLPEKQGKNIQTTTDGHQRTEISPE